MELWDIYDIDRHPVGRTHQRGAKMQEGDYHLTVHVCVFNSHGEMLIQRRQPFKEGFPGMWDITVGGSALAGETSRMAATRELCEEVGISFDFTDRLPHITLPFSTGFDDIYLIEQNADSTKLQLQYEEVAEVKWATRKEIHELLSEGRFIPYYPHLIDLFFEIRHAKNGAHQDRT